MRLFGYPYNNDLVTCKGSPDYLEILQLSQIEIGVKFSVASRIRKKL